MAGGWGGKWPLGPAPTAACLPQWVGLRGVLLWAGCPVTLQCRVAWDLVTVGRGETTEALGELGFCFPGVLGSPSPAGRALEGHSGEVQCDP